MRIISAFIFFMCLVGACMSCGENRTQQNTSHDDAMETQEKLIEQNREYLKQERLAIENFIEENKLTMQRTGSGLYYVHLKDAPKDGEAIADGEAVEYAFDLYLLDGTLLKSSTDGGTRTIVVGKDQVEIGLHEAFKLMRMGQRTLFVFPSHLAYGIAGNTDNVPPRTPVAFEIEPLKKLK